MTSTTTLVCSASSETIVSTIASPSNAGGTVRVRVSVVAADWRIASSTASQNCWASCWSRGTDTKATRRSLLERSDHVRSSDVFPLPGGAEMTVTFLVGSAIQRGEEVITAEETGGARNGRRSRLGETLVPLCRRQAGHAGAPGRANPHGRPVSGGWWSDASAHSGVLNQVGSG